MSRLHKSVNLLGVAIPPTALIVAIVLLWHRAIGPLELSLMIGLYFFTGFGVTLGFHRMLTHRAFESSAALRAVLAVLGSMAVEGSVITWVADHRKHHAFTDVDGDPHSPHLSGPGLGGALRGLWHAHIGWLFENVGQAERERFAPDLVRDPVLRVVDRLFFLWVALGLLIPFALGWAIGGTLGAALTALLWAGLVRVLLLHHVTWSINSVCHFFGKRRFDVDDESRNVGWLAPFSFGEAWHHNHHAFPTSAFHGLRLWERITDPTGLLILMLEKCGLVWGVVRISPERQAAKLKAAASSAAQVASSAAQVASTAAQVASTAAQAASNAAQAVSSGAIVSPAPSRLPQ